MRTAIFILVFLSVPSMAIPATIYVPDDYGKIQDAINVALNGDVVIVRPMTYEENIDFIGKAIVVKSEQGPEVTIIDGGNPANPDLGSVVTFQNNEGLDSVLDGFTIINGTGTYIPSYGYYYGGGIICTGTSPTLSNNIITENVADYGGGIYCRSISCPLIADNEIHGNSTASGGGGILCYDGSSATITNNYIHVNSAGKAGGGLRISNASPLIKDNRIEQNMTGTYGGGLWCVNSNCAITENIINQNQADTGSGGIHIASNSNVNISNNIINENTATNYTGGGIGVVLGASVALSSNMVSENVANTLGGGVACYDEATVIALNNTIVGNDADSGGGIMCSLGSSFDICNSILWDNSAFSGPEIWIGVTSSPSTFDISHSDVKGGLSSAFVEPTCTLNWGPSMIDADPIFVDHANDDFHLTYNSPCRDTGDNSVVTELTDFEGDPRIAWGGTVDMGADEFYTHLYITGDQTPDGDIQGKFVGLPGTTPVRLFIGLGGVRPTPLPTAYGDLWLLPPRLSIPLVSIPANGILAISATIPVLPPAPYDIPMQGLVGLNSDSLTNLCVLEVR